MDPDTESDARYSSKKAKYDDEERPKERKKEKKSKRSKDERKHKIKHEVKKEKYDDHFFDDEIGMDASFYKFVIESCVYMSMVIFVSSLGSVLEAF